jgi:peptidoglycan/xylan/chitin deacetylase (PgdA/CDA1 family)
MGRAIPVLMYHHVSQSPGLVTVSPETFRAQMELVVRAGYAPLGADRLLACLRGQEETPRRAVVITFDDGYLDNYAHAFPVLESLGLRAIVFAVTGWVGEGPARPHARESPAQAPAALPSHRECLAAIGAGEADRVMVRWDEIRRMAAAGCVETHSHTHTHQRWDRVHSDSGERRDALEADLRASRVCLRERLGLESHHLCWPWGYAEAGYHEIAARVGFAAQYGVTKGANAAGMDPRRIHRVVVKDRPGSWLGTRLWIYSRPWAARLYARLRGDRG